MSYEPRFWAGKSGYELGSLVHSQDYHRYSQSSAVSLVSEGVRSPGELRRYPATWGYRRP